MNLRRFFSFCSLVYLLTKSEAPDIRPKLVLLVSVLPVCGWKCPSCCLSVRLHVFICVSTEHQPHRLNQEEVPRWSAGRSEVAFKFSCSRSRHSSTRSPPTKSAARRMRDCKHAREREREKESQTEQRVTVLAVCFCSVVSQLRRSIKSTLSTCDQ